MHFYWKSKKDDLDQDESERMDRLIALVAGVVFLVCCYILTDERLLYPLRPALVQPQIPIGHLAFVDQLVSRKLSNDLVWMNSKTNETLYDADQLFTHDGARTRIELLDRTQIELGEKSLLVLNQQNHHFSLDLKAGTLKISLRKNSGIRLNNNGKWIDLKSSNQPADIEVFPSANHEVQIKVNHGEVDIDHDGKSQTVSAKNDTLTLADTAIETTAIAPPPNPRILKLDSGLSQNVLIKPDSNDLQNLNRKEPESVSILEANTEPIPTPSAVPLPPLPENQMGTTAQPHLEVAGEPKSEEPTPTPNAPDPVVGDLHDGEGILARDPAAISIPETSVADDYTGSRSSKINFDLGLQWTYLNFTRPGIGASISESAMTLSGGIRRSLIAGLLEGSIKAYVNLATVVHDKTKMKSARFYGVNVKGDYILPWSNASYTYKASLGWFMWGMITSAKEYAVSSLFAPAAYFSVGHLTETQKRQYAYAKLAILRGKGPINFENREWGLGIGTQINSSQSIHPCIWTLDFSNAHFKDTKASEFNLETFSTGVTLGF